MVLSYNTTMYMFTEYNVQNRDRQKDSEYIPDRSDRLSQDLPLATRSNAREGHAKGGMFSLDDTSTRLKAARICDSLAANYGNTVSERATPPIDELILTILSQNTNDLNSQRAFDSLKAAYSSWEDVLSAREEDLAQVVRSSGSYRLKAKRIKAALAEVMTRVGALDLSLLRDMELDEATRWLTSIYGVGPKTAAIVLLFSFGKPTLPVDTHVWRVSKRLGLVPENTSRESAQTILEGLVPTFRYAWTQQDGTLQNGHQLRAYLNYEVPF